MGLNLEEYSKSARPGTLFAVFETDASGGHSIGVPGPADRDYGAVGSPGRPAPEQRLRPSREVLGKHSTGVPGPADRDYETLTLLIPRPIMTGAEEWPSG